MSSNINPHSALGVGTVGFRLSYPALFSPGEIEMSSLVSGRLQPPLASVSPHFGVNIVYSTVVCTLTSLDCELLVERCWRTATARAGRKKVMMTPLY